MKLKTLLFVIILIGVKFPVCAQHTLQDYIEFARQNSPVVKDNQNQIKTADYEIRRLQAFYKKFQVHVTGNYLFAPIISTDNGTAKLELNSQGANHYYGYDLSQTNGGLYQGLVTVTQPLFNNKRYKAFAEQVELSKLTNGINIKLTLHDLEKSVTDQYILCLLDKKQVLYYDSILLLLNDQLVIVRKLTEASLLQQSDLILLNIEYANNQNLLATYKAIYRRDLFDLQILCGLKDTAFVVLPDVSIPVQNLVSRSAYLEKFRLDSAGLFAAQKVFETKYLPQFSVFTNAGLNAIYAPQIPNRFGFSAGLTATWQLYDGRQRQLMQSKTNVQLETISFYRDSFNIRNELRRTKILATLQSNTDRKVFIQRQLAEYDNLLLAYKRQIMQGQLSIVNYITVLKNMISVKRDYYVLEANDLLLANEYNYWNW
ncbi:MAG: hypothetical protein JWQ38_3657 [Flavipsychrobacter sp.]|nr:hypothetical protein [Flavipsychrobacter sp.]